MWVTTHTRFIILSHHLPLFIFDGNNANANDVLQIKQVVVGRKLFLDQLVMTFTDKSYFFA